MTHTRLAVHKQAYKIMMVAGEPSGDMHAADLIKSLRKMGGEADFDCFGMGLCEMKRSGLRQLVDASDLSLVGLFEVITHYPKLRRAYRRLKCALKEEVPDLLVLVDYPDFNLRLAAHAQRLGVKTLFYISPQVWAWRARRIRTIAQRIDMMAVIFPFEEEIYRKAGVPVRYVGHPLVDRVHTPSAYRSDEHHGRKKLLLMPGSRAVEIRRLLPILCRAAQTIVKAQTAQHLPAPQLSLLLSPGIESMFVERQLRKHHLECELICKNSYATMRNSDLAITASGTATLELALCGTPMIVVYKVSWPTYFLLKRLIEIPYIALVNIVAGKMIVPELIQGAANPDAICKQALAVMQNLQHRQRIKRELAQVRQALGTGGSAERLAALVNEMVGATT